MNSSDKNLLDSFDNNKIACAFCKKFFDKKLTTTTPLLINSKIFKRYYRIPKNIYLCSSYCWAQYKDDILYPSLGVSVEK